MCYIGNKKEKICSKFCQEEKRPRKAHHVDVLPQNSAPAGTTSQSLPPTAAEDFQGLYMGLTERGELFIPALVKTGGRDKMKKVKTGDSIGHQLLMILYASMLHRHQHAAHSVASLPGWRASPALLPICVTPVN